MNADLTRLLDGLVGTLARHIAPGEGLHDPHAARPTPPDHYGNTAAALALAAGDAYRPAGHEALLAWLATDDRHIGHLPFNHLLLRLLEHALSVQSAPAADLQPVRRAIARCGLRKAYPSNNWSLLAQCCRLLDAPSGRKKREAARYCALLDKWTTRHGGFIDFPARPGRHFATPIAYHHKALFLTALAAWFHDDRDLVRHAHRLLDWLVHCWDPAGYAGGLGRSNHALFGDGCLIAALVLLGFDSDDESTPVTALVRRLTRQLRPDGFLWLTPSGPESGDASWDSYMHLSVYNAWAAAVIGAARLLRRERPPPAGLQPAGWNGARTGCFHDEQSGLLCLRTSAGATAMLSTHGQPPQAFSRDEVDFRYAGGLVLHLSDGHYRTFIPPPVRTTRAHLLAHPELAGWVPVFRVGDALFALTDFTEVAVEDAEDGVSLVLRGNPTVLTRSAPTGLARRALAALDWRVFGGRLGRGASLRRARCESITARVRIDCHVAPPRLAVELEIDVAAGARVDYLNPAGHCTTRAESDSVDFEAPAVPASLPGAVGSCLPPQPLSPGAHAWKLATALDARGRLAAVLSGECGEPADVTRARGASACSR